MVSIFKLDAMFFQNAFCGYFFVRSIWPDGSGKSRAWFLNRFPCLCWTPSLPSPLPHGRSTPSLWRTGGPAGCHPGTPSAAHRSRSETNGWPGIRFGKVEITFSRIFDGMLLLIFSFVFLSEKLNWRRRNKKLKKGRKTERDKGWTPAERPSLEMSREWIRGFGAFCLCRVSWCIFPLWGKPLARKENQKVETPRKKITPAKKMRGKT